MDLSHSVAFLTLSVDDILLKGNGVVGGLQHVQVLEGFGQEEGLQEAAARWPKQWSHGVNTCLLLRYYISVTDVEFDSLVN